MCVNVCVCVCVVYVCVYIYIYVYVYMYMYTGFFEKIVGVLTICHLVPQMQHIVISF